MCINSLTRVIFIWIIIKNRKIYAWFIPPKHSKKISWINIKFTCADAIQIYHLPFYIKSWIHHRYGDIPVKFMKTVTSFESKVNFFYPRPWVKEIQHCWNMGPSSVWRGDNFKLLKNLFALKSRLIVQER